jgi:hypothetical protein
VRLIRTIAYGLRIVGVGLIRRAFSVGGRCGMGPQSDEELLEWLRSLAGPKPTFEGGVLLGSSMEKDAAIVLTPGYYSTDGGKTWVENPTAEQIQAALDKRRKAPR